MKTTTVPIEGLRQSDYTLLHSFYGNLHHDALNFSMASDCLSDPLEFSRVLDLLAHIVLVPPFLLWFTCA